ncbi:hypothetical protein [Archaeoglobus neptunius]|uniref:hypothetical protein n=1 Tax=Archaeoglobus neptunius TaxID=2798580 RepID=UPI001927CE14|nr:hypothetical protein [Archaeoglobus neptunius]
MYHEVTCLCCGKRFRVALNFPEDALRVRCHTCTAPYNLLSFYPAVVFARE